MNFETAADDPAILLDTQRANAAPRLTEAERVLFICGNLQKMNMTPKQFLVSFLTDEDPALAFRRRFWGTATGWASTQEMLNAIKDECTRTQYGAAQWRQWIQHEAIEILNVQQPPRGNFPNGSFHSTRTIEPTFFGEDAAQSREQSLTRDHMPFLFNILLATLDPNADEPAEEIPDQAEEPENINPDSEEENILHSEEVGYEGTSSVRIWKEKLRSAFHSLKTEGGYKVIYQSHKNHIQARSLEMFLQMARNYDILDQFPGSTDYTIPDCEDTLVVGLNKLKSEIAEKGELSRFKLHFMWGTLPGEINNSLVQEHATTLDDELQEEEDNSSDTPGSPMEM
ncbi:hypothetical protein PtB15_4B580 [Puccinia triticina]|nr:hypothetical protein PtB15_4B580 [Puccinia triticina]